MLNFDFWLGKRVLLTGHTGFKGSWLLLLLQQLGAEVWTYSLEPEGSSCLFSSLYSDSSAFNGWHHNIGDLSDRLALDRLVQTSQPEVVLHLAAQPLVRRSYQDPVGTWSTNVLGSLHLLDSLRLVNQRCSVVMVTTDKVYENQEWSFGYRENDRLGGHDPYSASKAATEIAISSWRSSFCGTSTHQSPHLRIATARSGNVIGGGDWAQDRIVPDAIRSLMACKPIPIRNPRSTRPWQHVIEPLFGYLKLAESLSTDNSVYCDAFNFGPAISSNRSVQDLVSTILILWPGHWLDQSNDSAPHEAGLLHLQIDKAYHQLSWFPRWDFEQTLSRTVGWYRAVHEGCSPIECCLADLHAYTQLLQSS